LTARKKQLVQEGKHSLLLPWLKKVEKPWALVGENKDACFLWLSGTIAISNSTKNVML
jgi:hypothetical protein